MSVRTAKWLRSVEVGKEREAGKVQYGRISLRFRSTEKCLSKINKYVAGHVNRKLLH